MGSSCAVYYRLLAAGQNSAINLCHLRHFTFLLDGKPLLDCPYYDNRLDCNVPVPCRSLAGAGAVFALLSD